MRCLTLAHELARGGAEIIFLCDRDTIAIVPALAGAKFLWLGVGSAKRTTLLAARWMGPTLQSSTTTPSPDTGTRAAWLGASDDVDDCKAVGPRSCVTYDLAGSESGSGQFRRLFVTRDIGAGAVFATDNVRSVRSGHGLPPKYLPDVIGRRAQRAVKRGEALTWDMIA